jgi:hypothetical protein
MSFLPMLKLGGLDYYMLISFFQLKKKKQENQNQQNAQSTLVIRTKQNTAKEGPALPPNFWGPGAGGV